MKNFEEQSPRIQEHLKSLAASSQVPQGKDALELVYSNWISKQDMTRQQCQALGMVEQTAVSGEHPGALLLLTYSGSLLFLGCPGPEGKRSLEYASLGLRSDVPPFVREKAIDIVGDLKQDSPAVFQGGAVGRSSELQFLATFSEEVDPAEQERRLQEALVYLTNGFVKINATLASPGEGPDHFTKRNMVRFVAQRRGLSQKVVEDVLGDFLAMAHARLLMGERPALGRLGRLGLVPRKARKARMGRNPATGEEILVPAQAPRMTPRFLFSSVVKERVANLPVEETEKG